jgi:maltose alpha-D-glucosyltransferase/alpha-amylase
MKEELTSMRNNPNGSPLADDPLWYKDAIVYQLHVRAFCDSDADGVGDFRGLTSKLHYLEELGVNTIWLLPFYPSPLKDDGYDIADYTDVHSSYGTIHDFMRFMREAHDRGIRVVTELVINHTSDQHPWFRRARRARPGSRERDFYVWSDTPDKYNKARIIFKDFEPSNWSADPVAKAYYWHRFYSHQPDLNFDNPEVRKAVFQVLDFWMRRGVDGLRLDAVPYLYEREGTSCENLPETHLFLKDLRRYIDARYHNRMLLAEANQWPDDAAAYFGAGDECHMNFHFPIMPRMFMAIRMEDRYPIVDILQQTPPIPDNCQWATFLRNHDELTLEMVTDRERDYMYQAYARDREMRLNLGIRRRLAPLLNDDRRAIELMNALLFSMPGSPVVYYGDEIGMGDNVYLGDRNGVRTPMQWSSDRSAGFSRANPQKLYLPVIIDPQFHYESVNVEAQESNSQSLLWWMRRLIGLRKRFSAFGRGSLEFLPSSNHKVLSFLRAHGNQQVLVVANLSRFAQQVDLELERFQGMVPVEAFGQTRFRPVGKEPYYLTLGPYSFYWFSLEPQRTEVVSTATIAAPLEIAVNGQWENALEGRARAILERGLPAYLIRQPRSSGKQRNIESTRTIDSIRIAQRSRVVYLLVVEIEYAEGSLETQVLPLAFADGEAAQIVQSRFPQAVVAHVRVTGKEDGLLYDAMWDEQFASLLLDLILRRRRHAGRQMEIIPSSRDLLQQILPSPDESNLTATILRAEHRRVVTVFSDKLLLKTYRRLEPAINPDLEVGRFLTERAFAHAPATVGSLQIRRPGYEPMTLAILRQFVLHEGTAWQHAIDSLGQYFEAAMANQTVAPHEVVPPGEDLWSSAAAEPPKAVGEIAGFYPAQAALLGRRTAEFHAAMAAETEDPAFTPEPFTNYYQRSQYQALHYLQARTLQALQARLAELSPETRAEGLAVLDAAAEIRKRFLLLRDRKIESLRIRCHGNYHLGQVLYTGKDFMITDFEGDPGHSLSERRAKRSAMHDVASMLHSFHQAAYTAMLAEAEGTLPAGLKELEPWYRFWQAWVPVSFLRGYLEAAGKVSFVPSQGEEASALLNVCLLEELLTELRYELEHRPAWVRVPLQGILQLLRPAPPPAARP